MNHEFEKKLYRRVRDLQSERRLPQFGNPHVKICTVDDLAIYSQVGQDMGIPVKVLNNAGEVYDRISSTVAEVDGAPVGESISFKRETVPDGHARIEIANEIRRMGEFYTRVDANSQQNI